jgi:hypothetical protein
VIFFFDWNIVQVRIANLGMPVPLEHRIDCLGKLCAARFVDAARVDPLIPLQQTMRDMKGGRILQGDNYSCPQGTKSLGRTYSVFPAFSFSLTTASRDLCPSSSLLGPSTLLQILECDFIGPPAVGEDSIIRDVASKELVKLKGRRI